MKSRRLLLVCLIQMCMGLIILNFNTVHAAGKYPEHDLYEANPDLGYILDMKNNVEIFSYGADRIGVFCIDGNIAEQGQYGKCTAYGVNDIVSFKYNYEGNFNSGIKTEWNIISDGSKTVAEIDVGKKINKGLVLVQKSSDEKTWENAAEPINNYFAKATSDEGIIYTTTGDEIKQGTYYRVMVAYSMKIKVGVNDRWLFLDSEIYETKEFIEVYEFFVCSNKNYVQIKDSISRENKYTGQSVQEGFYIDKNGSFDSVVVSKAGGLSQTVNAYDFFTEPGDYNILVTTKLGREYKTTIKIDKGLSSVSLSPAVYECKKGNGFVDGTLMPETTTYGIKSLSKLTISQNAGYTTTKSTYNGYDAYGINGDAVRIFMTLNYPMNLEGNGWNVVDSSWGKKEKEKIFGVQTGEMGNGALIIQTSFTGKEGEWENVGKDRYSLGLYTTDYASYYDENENVFIYSPVGADVLKGVYIRVIYAYQVHNKVKKQYIDCLERYEFYLCSNELGAVTFHNESLEGKIKDILGNEDENIIEIYKQAETLETGSGTFAGFRIDISRNPTVQYTVKKNGNKIVATQDGRYTLTGKYDIELKSAVGDVQNITIYVDRSSNDEALVNYFGENFILGKRIYAEGEYPIYEGGSGTTYNLMEVSENYLPVKGQICNLDTQSIIEIEESRAARSGSINEPGRYIATFTTGAAVGDMRTFTFRFSIIPEGTAPGPTLNQEKLAEYSKSNISDAYPIGYALTYQSAANGYIRVVFRDKKDAIDYAYSYEKGMVEKQSDGTYRYNGSLSIQQKEKYESVWDLTDAMTYFAEQAVEKYYFDLSDEYTYRTLSDEVLENTPNLRILELEQSVVVFAEGQKQLMTSLDARPIISEKPYLYLNPGLNGTDVPKAYHDYEFTRDRYGCDSNTVVITDTNGKEYQIEYNKGVGLQLRQAGCASGIVTITETTIYGDSVSYEAVYVAIGQNTSEVEIKYYDAGKEKSKVISAKDAGTKLEVDVFSIEDVKDELDPYSLIIISKDGTVVSFYASDQVMKEAWSEAGEYTVKIVNRLGAAYTFTINVRESDYSVITFSGEGTDDIRDIVTSYGEKDVLLPRLKRFGYDFLGYWDQNGQVFNEKMDVNFKTILTLTAMWQPKTIDLVIKDSDGNVRNTKKVNFGSEIKLDVPLIEDGQKFVEWRRNGNVLTEPILIVDTEEPIVILCMMDNSAVESETLEETFSQNPEDAEKKKIASYMVWLIMLALMLGGGGIAVVLKYKMNEKLNKADSIVTGADNDNLEKDS